MMYKGRIAIHMPSHSLCIAAALHGWGDWRTPCCSEQKSNNKYGNEHEAIAVYHMMRGVERFCPIYTLCIGNAFGEAALLLSAGSKVGPGSPRRAQAASAPLPFHLNAAASPPPPCCCPVQPVA